MRHHKPEPSKLEEPSEEFIFWWTPSGRDPSGADTGGHPDAERVWARKDPGRWTHRTYGISARIAWNAQPYRSEFLRWIESGRPDRENFVSLAAPLETQKQFWRDLKPTIAQIGKPMPKISEGDVALESGASATQPDP